MPMLGLVKAETVKKNSQETSDFGPAASANEMKLVHHEKEACVVVLDDPAARLVDNGAVHLADEHGVQYRLVGDKNVRRGFLHVPSATPFRLHADRRNRNR